jgi:hypothetical protein
MYSFDLYILVYLCKFTVTLYIQKISCQDVQTTVTGGGRTRMIVLMAVILGKGIVRYEVS